MSNVSIGVTAMELFAYNPFRILGIAVNTTRSETDKVYNELLRLADSGDISGYTTPFDFPSLPPFSRSAQTIKTAYAKLASNGYRCFAYSDSEFSVSLNIDDIALNLRDITCYDCFLRCYMWLIINDRELQERDLWIQLAAYIDKMIMSSPEQWEKYFDDRFPDEMLDSSMSALKSFYATFSEIILLPLKEMVRGSMKCSNATDILKCAGIDVNEKFDYIEIPQANVPKNGEPAPKLKIALKDGEEYFDISTGTMKYYSTDTETAESNSFAGSNFAPLAADDIINVEPETPAEPEQVYEEPAYEESQYVQPEAEGIPAEAPEAASTAPAAQAAPAPAPVRSERRMPERRSFERSADGVAAPKAERKAPPKPTQTIAPKPEPLKLDAEAQPQTPPRRTAPAPAPQQSAPVQRRSFKAAVSDGEQQPRRTAPAPAQNTTFNSETPFFKIKSEESAKPQEAAPAKRADSFTNIVKEAEKKEEEAYLSEEGEENLFTNALIEMLKTNQARGETMKSVDTKHVKVSESEMTAPAPKKVSMSEIDMNRYDEKLLATSNVKVGEKLTREQRYRNIKIDDMLGTKNPARGGYQPNAIEEYKKQKAKEKQSMKNIFITIGVFALILVIFIAMWFAGII